MDPSAEKKRLFVGGLFDGIEESDLVEKFSRFGQVESVELKARRTEDGQTNTFAFMEMMITPKNLAKCFSVYSNTRWKGGELKLEVAKESFLSRLQKEREQASDKSKTFTSVSSNTFEQKSTRKEVTFGDKQLDDAKQIESTKRPTDSPSPLKSKKSKNEVPMFQGTATLLRNKIDESPSPDTKTAKKAVFINDRAIEGEPFGQPEPGVNGLRHALKPDFQNGHYSANQKPRGSGLLSRLEKFSGTWNDFEVVGKEARVPLVLSAMSEKERMADKRKLESIHNKISKSRLEKFSGTQNDFEIVRSEATMRSSVSEKKKLSDKKRLESIHSKVSESNAKQKLIKSALRNLDAGVQVNSKIVFDDEFGDNKTGTNQFASEERTQKKSRKVSKEKQNMTLFDSDSEEDLPMDSQDMFRIKPQYEGKTGQKIMALQSRFGNDERFKIDERFAESESEDNHDEELNSQQETQRQLDVLASVLGYALPQKPKNKLTNDWKKMTQMRYDPTLENASQLEIHEEEQSSVAKTAKCKGKADELPEEILPEVSQERYYKVSTSLKDIFYSGKKSGNESFSLLQSLGAAAPSKNDQDDRGIDTNAYGKAIGPRTAWNNNPFKYDSSSDEEEETGKQTNDGKQTTQTSVKTQNGTIEGRQSSLPSARRTFFVFDGDSRLEDGVKFFTRPDNLDAVRQTWKQTRFSLMEHFRDKLKKAQQDKVGKTKVATAAKRRFDTTKSKFKSKRKPFTRPRR